MKLFKVLSVALALQTTWQSASAGVHFGMANAVKERVEKLDGKVRSGSFRVVNGATVSGSGQSVLAKRGGVRSAVLTDGSKWRISPNQVRFTVTQAVLYSASNGPSQSIKFKSATATYDRSLNSKSILLNESIKVREGTYREIQLTLSNQFEVLINDDTNGIYTDPESPTLLTQTKPVGGGQFVTYDASQNSAFASGITVNTSFNNTLDVGDGHPDPVINMVVDMTRTININVSGSTLSFNYGLGGADVPIVVVPFVSGLASAKVYARADHPEFNYEYYSPGNPEVADEVIRVFFDSDGQPSRVIFSAAQWPVVDNIGNPDLCFRRAPPGFTGRPNYLGKDSAEIISFATIESSGSQYRTLASFADFPSLGDLTTINLKNTSSPPPPSSGDDYSSGTPTFTADTTVSLQLIAR